MLDDPVWYFAFGSNMNDRLFRERRHMTPVETRIARLDSWRLCFTAVGGRKPGKSAPANIVEAPGSAVHGVLYLLPLRKFVRLDASEGMQYDYLRIEVLDATGRSVPAITFKVAADAPEGHPSLPYMRIVREAARERELPPAYIDFLEHVVTAA
ncbi:MAG: gamma-glutamylcyclotransferase [Rhodanobacter sp.]|nr:MAG: gamma-glutamylcyclotransferase [Rhodanobacter sp.]TAL99615.1 MAG: gamma-glutamylcyclotransferase [Rhodanobacter sp.]TAM41066.1 MAG: gamma-glutamylcyclotransferase [Rhodanobacter sp.]